MHELAIADSIVQTVLQEIERKNLPAVETIVVRVGALSGVVPDALQFGFDAIKIDTPLSNTQLKIEAVPVNGKCRDCDREFEVEQYVFLCPWCQSRRIEVIRGEELDIAYLEVEDEQQEESDQPDVLNTN